MIDVLARKLDLDPAENPAPQPDPQGAIPLPVGARLGI